MAEIYLSYDHNSVEDWTSAHRASDALKAKGYSVFEGGFDNNLGIESEIETARVILVLWSRASVENDDVRAEAYAAKASKPSKLVQMRLEECALPLGVSMVQYADCFGDFTAAPGWQKVLGWIAEIVRFRPGTSGAYRAPLPPPYKPD